jgi:hypothetical protein
MAATPANNATLINLDPALFNVSATTGDGTSNVGLNKDGQIRLYSTRTTGVGNTLSISISSGYTITSVVFTFGASTTSQTGALILGSADPIVLASTDLTNVTKTYDSLNITSFSLQNTFLNKSGSTNAQIYILSITITYESVNP